MSRARLVTGGQNGPAPLVTVVTPTFRRDPAIVARCIDCMRLQDEPSWEQLVCSDGEEEGAIRDLVDWIGDERVSYWHTRIRYPEAYGTTVRNEMLRIARGRYVMFLDDDNVIVPTYLSRMVAAIAAEDRDFAVCRVVHFGPLNEAETGPPPIVLTGDPLKKFHIDTLQFMVRTDVMQACRWNVEAGYLSDGVTFEALAARARRGWTLVPEVLGFHL